MALKKLMNPIDPEMIAEQIRRKSFHFGKLFEVLADEWKHNAPTQPITAARRLYLTAIAMGIPFETMNCDEALIELRLAYVGHYPGEKNPTDPTVRYIDKSFIEWGRI